MRSKRPEVNREVMPVAGLACWVLEHDRHRGMPWWPARVVDRAKYEDICASAAGFLAPASDTNCMVQFFDGGSQFSVAEIHDVCEYTTNMHLLHQSGRRADLVDACRRANQFIGFQGTPEQQSRLKQVPFEELVRSKGKRFSSAASAGPGVGGNASSDVGVQPQQKKPKIAVEDRRSKRKSRGLEDLASIKKRDAEKREAEKKDGEPKDVVSSPRVTASDERLSKDTIQPDPERPPNGVVAEKPRRKSAPAPPPAQHVPDFPQPPPLPRKAREVAAALPKVDATPTAAADKIVVLDEVINASRMLHAAAASKLDYAPDVVELRAVNRLVIHSLPQVPMDTDALKRGCLLLDTELAKGKVNTLRVEIFSRLVLLALCSLRDTPSPKSSS